MHEVLRDWADTLRATATGINALADEADSVADKIEDGIFVHPDDIQRLTDGSMIPNVTEAHPVKVLDTDLEVTTRSDETYYVSEAQCKEHFIVQQMERSIEDALKRGLVVQVRYANAKVFWFRQVEDPHSHKLAVEVTHLGSKSLHEKVMLPLW